MCECVGNNFTPTANGNVEGADMLAGAGILNFLNVYLQQTSINSHYSLDNSVGFGVEIPQSYMNDYCPNSICRPNLVSDVFDVMCYCVLKETNFRIALAMASWVGELA